MRKPRFRGLPFLWAAALLIVTSSAPAQDCNTNAIPDSEEGLPDCNTNGLPDECELGSTDYALDFDGINDVVVIGNPDELNFEGHITIEAWVRPDNDFIVGNIVAHGYSTSPLGQVALRILFGNYNIEVFDADNIATVSTPVGGDVGSWVHLAATYDGAAWRLFRNGVEKASIESSLGAVMVNADWAIGARFNGTERLMDGGIDEVRIWNIARSAAEIQGSMNTVLSGLEPGLVGYWRFDEGSGAVAADTSANGNDGALNGPTWIYKGELYGTDCNTDGTVDVCQLDLGDCNSDGTLDICDVIEDDCNTDGLPDECALADYSVSYVSTPELVIVDGATVSDTLTIPAGEPVNDLNVQVVITHPFMGDLFYWLEHGQDSVILSYNFGGGDADADILFDDSAASVPFGSQIGTYRAYNALNPLVASGDPSGDWTLRIADGPSSGDSGILNEWSLHFSHRDDCNTNNQPDLCELVSGAAPDCNTNGIVDACDLFSGESSDCNTSGVPDACELAAGSSTDCNTNAALDECDVVRVIFGVLDCDTNGQPDECDLAAGAADCNTNAVPDCCDTAERSAGLFDATHHVTDYDSLAFVVAADFDRDGHVDLAAIDNEQTGRLSVFRNDAAGGLLQPAVFMTGDWPYNMAVADLDGDGDPDLVTANPYYLDQTVGVLLNDGSGGFAEPVNYPINGSSAYSVVTADFDGDIHIDVAVIAIEAGDGVVAIMFNNGNGTLAPPIEYNLGDFNVFGLAAADVDGDQDQDLIVGEYDDPAFITVLINNGGVFSIGGAYPAYAGGVQIATGDFDGDNDIDVATTNWNEPGFLTVLFNDGLGDYSERRNYAMEDYPSAVLAVDADVDGDLDLAVAIDTKPIGYLFLLVNDGAGQFKHHVVQPVDEYPESIAAADLTGDGKPEIITGNWVSSPHTGSISVVSNLRPAPRNCNANLMPDECEIAAGLAEDCNTNGAVDSCDLLPVRDFKAAAVHSTDATAFLTAGDIDGDEDIDLVIIDYSGAAVTAYRNDGLGGFTPGTPRPTGPSPYGSILVDIDNNNGVDLVIASQSNPLQILFNNGAGEFSSSYATETGVDADVVTAADFNGDGYQDLALAGYRSATNDHAVTIQINDQTGGLYPAGDPYQFGDGLYEMASADFDGDTDLDLLVASWADPEMVTVLLNNGDASFEIGPAYPAAGGGLAMATGDFDGDGDIDAATANWDKNPGRLSVLLNDGSGTFTVADHETQDYPAGVWTGDFDGDGDLDLLVPIDDPQGFATVFLNNGAGQFHHEFDLLVGQYPEASFVADFNGDGKPDIVTGDYGNSQPSFSLLLNDRMPPIAADADEDGQPDECRDSDGDGVPDAHDRCPGVADGPDSDGDGQPDGCDGCPNDPNKKEPGVCGCGAADDDSDGDAILDCDDICPGADDKADSDGDTVPDCLDRCPGGDDTIDADGDGVPDCAQGPDAKPDADGDGLPDADDNCPQTANADQADADGDGVGDACDAFAGPNPPGDLPPADAPGDTPMDEQPPADQMSPSEDMCGIGACGGGSGSALAMALLSLSGFRRKRRLAAT